MATARHVYLAVYMMVITNEPF